MRREGGGGGSSRQTEERKEVRRFVSGDKSFSLGSPVNQRAPGGGGRGAVNQLGGEGEGEEEGEEVKKGDEGSEGDLLNDLFIFCAFVYLTISLSLSLSLVLVTKISLPTWYVTVRSTVTV